MRNRAYKVLLTCFLGVMTSWSQVWAQATIQANSTSINNGNNVIIANTPTRISSFNVNTGTVYIPNGDSIELMVSVNGDTPTRVVAEALPYSMYPLTMPVSPPTGINFLRLTENNYMFSTARFGGGGGLLNDITIWPTKAAGGSSVGVVVADTFRTQVLYIDGAGFKVSNNQIVGLPSMVGFDEMYTLNITAQNTGIDISKRPIEFFVQLDDYDPVLLGAASTSLPINGTFSIQVANFNLYNFYDYLQITNQFRYAPHSVILYAQEQGLVNSMEVARFSVDASMVLPVELQHFTGWLDEDLVRLSWTTLAEANNSHFILEKYNAKSGEYEELTNITGMGFSTEQQTYQFTDYFPQVGANLYRLVQVDYDGKEQILGNRVEVNYVMSGQKAEVLTVFPNPFSYKFSLRVISPEKSRSVIKVLNSQGQLAYQKEVEFSAGVSEVEIDLGDIPGGTYLYQTYINGKQLTGKIVKH